MNAQQPPPLFTKRERYALAGLSGTFIVSAAALHFMFGSLLIGSLPRTAPAPGPSPEIFHIDDLVTPTPTPVPTPTPPVSRPHTTTTQPLARAPEHHVQAIPGSHRPHTATAPPIAPPPRFVTPSAAPSEVPAAVVSPTPLAPADVTSADFIHRVTPDYPALAQEENAQGDVVVRVTIGPQGQLIDASIDVSSGNAALDAAALQAARASTFTPPLVDGMPAQCEYLIVYTFRLDV